MRKWLLRLAVLLVMSLLLWTSIRSPGVRKLAARPLWDSIVQIHFAGVQAITSSGTGYRAFENEFASPQARALESQTLDKLSRAPAVWFRNKLPTGAGDGSAQLRPLLDDFLKSEWIFELRDAPGSPEYALAIRLDANRAQLWQNNLRNLLESWTKISAQNIPGGWELKKDLAPNLFRFVRTGNWVIIGCGQNELPLSDGWVHTGTVPTIGTSWLTANVDWPRLAQLYPTFASFDFPAIKMQANGKDGTMQLTGTLDLSQPLPPLEKWQMPANLIHQPLTGFTAVRGFAPWLERQSWATLLGLSPEPDQLFSWSLGLMPLQTFIAVPVANGPNALAQLEQNLSANPSWQSHLMSPFHLDKSTYRLALTGAPFVAPEVQALRGSSGDVLFADVFPNLPRGKPAPPELSQALTQANLVFYHWEVTSERVKVLPQLTQLALFLTQHRQLNDTSAAGRWLDLIGPTLGSSVTEATETGLLQLSFTRSSSSGLTGLELIALANWLEAPNFPGCDLRIPPRRIFQIHRPMKKLSAPAPPVSTPH
jgi:hypothetical protein